MSKTAKQNEQIEAIIMLFALDTYIPRRSGCWPLALKSLPPPATPRQTGYAGDMCFALRPSSSSSRVFN